MILTVSNLNDSVILLKCPLFVPSGGGRFLRCMQGWHFSSALGCRLRSEDIPTAACVQRENSLWGQAKCGRCSHPQTAEISYITYIPPSLSLPSPAPRVCQHVNAWWRSQTIRTGLQSSTFSPHVASGGARKGGWLLPTSAVCPVSWGFLSAGSGWYALPGALPEKDPSYLAVGSAAGSVERGVWSSQKLEKESDDERKGSENKQQDWQSNCHCLVTSTCHLQQLYTLWHYAWILGSPATLHLTWGDSTFAK